MGVAPDVVIGTRTVASVAEVHPGQIAEPALFVHDLVRVRNVPRVGLRDPGGAGIDRRTLAPGRRQPGGVVVLDHTARIVGAERVRLAGGGAARSRIRRHGHRAAVVEAQGIDAAPGHRLVQHVVHPGIIAAGGDHHVGLGIDGSGIERGQIGAVLRNLVADRLADPKAGIRHVLADVGRRSHERESARPAHLKHPRRRQLRGVGGVVHQGKIGVAEIGGQHRGQPRLRCV